jgi:hypothetical protein
VPTRFYLPATGTAPTGSFVPPTGSGAGQWSNVGSALIRPLVRAKTNTALATTTVTRTSTGANPFDRLHRVYVSEPLPVAQTISGSFSAVIKAWTDNAGYNTFLQVGIRVTNADGSVVRGILYDGSSATVESQTVGAENQEIAGTTSAALATRIKNAIPLSRSVAAQAGDRIVISIGNRGTALTTSTMDVTYQWGDPTATADLPLTAGSTAAGVPWIELSQDVFAVPDLTLPYSESFTGTDGTLPSPWADTSHGTAAIQGNALQLTQFAAAWASANARLMGGLPQDFEMAWTWTLATSTEQYPTITARMPASAVQADYNARASDGFYLQCYPAGASVQYGLTVASAKTGTEASVSGSPVTAVGVAYRNRLRIEGNRVRYRAWIAANSEPSTWLIDDSSYTLPAGTQVSLGNTSATASVVTTIDDVTITTPPAAAVTSLVEVTQRGRNDDGTQASATWKAAAGTGWSQPLGSTFRVRHLIRSENGATSTDWQAFYSHNGGAWTPVTGTSSPVRAVATDFLTDGAATTQQLGSGSFVAGTVDEGGGFFGTTSLGANQETELEGAYQVLAAGAAVGDTVRVRLHRGNWAAFDAYTTTPTITVAAAETIPPGTPGAVLDEPFTSYPLTQWPAGTTQGPWVVKWDGGGTIIPVDVSGDRVLQLESSKNPVADEWGDTASSLVVSTTRNSGDLVLKARARTIAQLRDEATPAGSRGTPNAWECAWLGWNHSTVAGNQQRYYYVALKPNGFELGKVDQTTTLPGGQRFLWTDSTPFTIGTWYDVEVRQVGSNIKVWVDGTLRADFTDGAGSQGTPVWGTAGETVMTAGAVVMYHEDARVQFSSVQLNAGLAVQSSASSPAGATDTHSRTLTANRTAVDAAGATDTHSRTLEANRTAVDSAGATDAHSWTMAAGRSATDSAGATDTHAWTMDSGRTAVDVAGATDSASRTLEANRGASDTAGATDSHAWSMDVTRAQVSTAGATDTAAWTMDAGRTQASAAGASDAHSWSMDAGRSAVDSAGATDTASRTLEANRGAVSTAGASDAVTVAIDYVRTATSGAGAVDSVTTSTAQGQDRSASSAAGATDTVTTSLDAQRSTVSTAGAVDSVTVAIDYVRMASSGAGATDTASASLTAVRSASSGAGAVDAAGTAQDYTRTATSTAGVADTASWSATVVRTASSSADARDEVTVQAAGQTNATATSAAGATDTVAVIRDVVRYASSDAGASDTVTPVRDVHRAASSSAGAVDAASTSAAAGQERSAVSAAGATDAATTQLDSVRAVVSTAGATDTVTWEMARTIVRYATSGAGATDELAAVRDVHRTASSAAGAVDAAATGRAVTAAAVSTAGATDSHSWTITTFRGAYVVRYGDPRTGRTGREGRLRTNRITGAVRYGHTKEGE